MYFPKTNRKSGLVVIVFLTLLMQYAIQENDFIKNANASSPISVYGDTYSPGSIVHILIHAPDFDSNPYAIDTIGDDSNGQVAISTRGASIPYRLVETGPDTGIFSGEVILSSTTSVCSPICGPTDGYIAASGDDGLTVSFTYATGSSITYRWNPSTSSQTIPEFGMFSDLTITLSIISVIIISRKFTKN